MNSAASDRDVLARLLEALERPARADGWEANSRVISIARHHRLSPLLSAVCSRSLGPDLIEPFRRDRVISAARGMILASVAEECIAAMAGRGIPTIVLKGLDYERRLRLYAGSGLRPTGDVDLMVPNDLRRQAFKTLDELGFEPRAAAPGFDDHDYHEVAWQRSGVEIDLHMGLAPTARCAIDYRAVWREREAIQLGTVSTSVLGRAHAVVFHALHMNIDHFAIPAIYLIDFAQLLEDGEQLATVETIAAQWRCQRPLATSLALTAAFLPIWRGRFKARITSKPSRIVDRFGGTQPLSRPEQLLRKLAHFDDALQAARYLTVQGARRCREIIKPDLRSRTARERLKLGGQ